MDQNTPGEEPTVPPSQVQPYLAWLEETDRELLAIYEQYRFRGIQARLIHGKFAIFSRGRPID